MRVSDLSRPRRGSDNSWQVPGEVRPDRRGAHRGTVPARPFSAKGSPRGLPPRPAIPDVGQDHDRPRPVDPVRIAWRTHLLENWRSALRRGTITQAEYNQYVRDMNLDEE